MLIDRVISAVVSTTGEVIEYHVQTPGEVSAAFRDTEAHIDAYRTIKNLLLNTGMELLSKQDKETK